VVTEFIRGAHACTVGHYSALHRRGKR